MSPVPSTGGLSEVYAAYPLPGGRGNAAGEGAVSALATITPPELASISKRRVIHIVENLDRGAVENWLLRMLRYARTVEIAVDWTFYCVVGRAGEIDNRAKTLGASVMYSPIPIGRKAEFVRALRAELRTGNYHVLHSHHDLVSAVYMAASIGLPIQRRLIHLHNADELLPTPNRLKQKLCREPMRRICLAMADRIVGVSQHTLDTFLGGRSRRPGRDIVQYLGLDCTPFRCCKPDPRAFRSRLNLPTDALVLLFGGRLVPEKNPLFTLDVLAQIRRQEPRAVAVFAGTGSLELQVAARAEELGLQDAVRLLGWRSDLPEIMASSDWFILPHLEEPVEGFGLAVVEAQLAGLRLLLSLGVSDDPLLPGATFRRLALSQGAAAWAKVALELLRETPLTPAEACVILDQSPMNMDLALAAFLKLHL